MRRRQFIKRRRNEGSDLAPVSSSPAASPGKSLLVPALVGGGVLLGLGALAWYVLRQGSSGSSSSASTGTRSSESGLTLDQIRHYQRILIGLQYPIRPTGTIDIETRAAIRGFQIGYARDVARHGEWSALPLGEPSGELTRDTRAAMDAHYRQFDSG